jgi:hypothetical protein
MEKESKSIVLSTEELHKLREIQSSLNFIQDEMNDVKDDLPGKTKLMFLIGYWNGQMEEINSAMRNIVDQFDDIDNGTF